MKRLRDGLIIVVLSGVVIWFATGFIHRMHEASLDLVVGVREADLACIEDHMICHVGYNSFQSEADAEAYMKSPEHLAAVKAREEKSAQQKQHDEAVNELKKQGIKKLRAICVEDGTYNCNLIDENDADWLYQVMIDNQAKKEARKMQRAKRTASAPSQSPTSQ